MIDKNATSCSVAGDGRTVLVSDYFGAQVHVFLMDPDAGTLEFRQSFDTLFPLAGPTVAPVKGAVKEQGNVHAETPVKMIGTRVLNIAVSPDGKTVVALGPVQDNDGHDMATFQFSCAPWVFRVNAPGRVVSKGYVALLKWPEGPRPESSPGTVPSSTWGLPSTGKPYRRRRGNLSTIPLTM